MPLFTIYGYDAKFGVADAVGISAGSLDDAKQKAAEKYFELPTRGAIEAGQPLPKELVEIATNAKLLREITGTVVPTYFQKCVERVQAYKNKALDNVIRSLPSVQGCEKTIERIAANIEAKKQ